MRLGMLALGASFAAACAPPAELTSTQAPADAPAEAVTATQPPAIEPTAAPTATQHRAAALPADRPFSASDPESVVLAAGRPQLVEFYNSW
jgi:peptidoglycan hydrolase-like protein with peptidoglycan-binding domain